MKYNVSLRFYHFNWSLDFTLSGFVKFLCSNIATFFYFNFFLTRFSYTALSYTLRRCRPACFRRTPEDCCRVAWCSCCWRGTLLWKQQWWSLCGGERSPPGTKRGTESSPRPFSCPARLSNKPSLLFTPSPAASPASVSPREFSRSLLLCVSPTLSVYSSCLFPLSLPRSLLSVSFFLLPHKDGHSPVALKGEQNVLWKCKKPAQKCHRSRDFCLKSRSLSPSLRWVTLCLSFTEGSLFSIGPVWERVRRRRWRGAAGPVPSCRERRWITKKGLTGHLYWCREVQQQRLKHAQSYLLKIHRSARPIRSPSECLCLGNERK